MWQNFEFTLENFANDDLWHILTFNFVQAQIWTPGNLFQTNLTFPGRASFFFVTQAQTQGTVQASIKYLQQWKKVIKGNDWMKEEENRCDVNLIQRKLV